MLETLVGFPLWDVGLVGRLCCVLPVWNHPQGELKGFWAPFASSRCLCVLIPVFLFLQHAESLFGFFLDRTPVIPVKCLRGASIPQAQKAHAWAVLPGLAVKKKVIPLSIVGRSQFWSKMAPGSSFHSIYNCRNDLSISQPGVCCGVMCSERWSCWAYFNQGKKNASTSYLSYCSSTCALWERARGEAARNRAVSAVCSVHPREETMHIQLYVAALLFIFFLRFWRKTSFSDSGFSPLLPRAGLWLRKNSWWKKDTSKRADGGGGGAYPFYYSIEHWSCYCWKYSLSLILFFLWLFLAVLITKTFLF